MEPFGIGIAGLSIAGLSTLGAFGLAFRQRRRRRLLKASTAPAPHAPRSTGDRLEALAAAQADLRLRLDTLAAEMAAGARGPEERLQAMAGQLVGLIRDKNATLETALAGLDQLRARMRTLEQIGEPAEARSLYDGLAARLDAIEQARAAADAGLEARLAALAAAGPDGAALAERLAGLEEKRAAGLEATLGRLAPLEARLGAIEKAQGADRAALEKSRDAEQVATREALKALEGRIETQIAEAGAAKAELAALKAETGATRALGEQLTRVLAQKEALAETLVARMAALESDHAARDPAPAIERLGERLAALEGAENPFTEIAEQLTRLYAQKDAVVERVFARLAPLEARLAELDPAAALDRFAERLEAVQGRVATLEGAENPFTEIAEQLTRLYAQKDATVETVFARLAPLETRLAQLDPTAAIDRFAERLEAVQGRVATLEGAENPFAEIAEQLTRLYAQKDATVETVFARLAPLEARLAELDPTAALDRFTARLEGFGDRLAAIEENPFADLSERLARLYEQKDAVVETVFARLAPLEARLAELDPTAALDRFAARLEAVQQRVETIEAAENPFAEISEQLTRLYAQKDATVETVFARLAPLEARLAELDPTAALDRFAERLETVQGRVATLEGAENPFAEIAEQLTRLYAQKDATVETVFARLAPLEARLAELAQGLDRLAPLAEEDPRAGLDGLRMRLEALQWAQGETAAGLAALRSVAEERAGEDSTLAEIADRLTRLFAQKDASLAAILARLEPLEARLAALETREPETAEVPAGAVELAAARAAADAAALFADRIAGIEARLPRVAAPRAAGVPAGGRPGPSGISPTVAAAAELEAILAMPGLVSLHRGEVRTGDGGTR